ncbi:UPF0449 protein C19orf25 homolog [Myripristis murdjan]|uniref:Si:ch73-238c9.1 n=1 Tax=Myripristis murdjan TaxID=586833 RepID=A0A667XIZ7_9TELE|nr:UPF0449 protein C19orf25 homolog [Myripristis murdjan]XP_029906175.1 UPF0449 protein C19orf25 homolog [Myripristis murdjan]
MNLGSRNKKRTVLPSRPAPPTVEQILEDLSRAEATDPVFSILDHGGPDSAAAADSDVELKFQQSRRLLQLNQRLQEARGRLAQQSEELREAGERLERDVAEVKGRAL